MNTAICSLLGTEFPLVAFSHCRDVVAEVSRAGGCGVLGAALMTPDELDVELSWIDDRVGGRAYGVDLIVPKSFLGKGGADGDEQHIPVEVRNFTDQLLRDHDIDPAFVPPVVTTSAESLSESWAGDMVEVALTHPIALIANALGPPPRVMLERAKSAGVPVGALVGTEGHALAQAELGVDFIVAQGAEAGGHTGEVSTMVLVPEVVQSMKAIGSNIPVLAAGGIITGRQMAAAIALGAEGVWTGSVWLTTHEAETAPYTKEKMLAAKSTDTVRSRYRTGKPSRQLRSSWHEAWERDGSPAPLPMPLMGSVSEPALRRADVLAQSGHNGAKALSTYWVGQGVGLMTVAKPAREVVLEMIDDYLTAVAALSATLEA